jgi:hypothetical protein
MNWHVNFESFLTQADEVLSKRLAHFFVLLAFALAFHGQSLSFGLIWDDHALLGSHWEWISSHWRYPWFYRPLQVFLFSPSIVSSSPMLLHLENIAMGALIIFMFGRLLVSLGFGIRFVFFVELVGVVLPTSLMLFTWISQRTEWFTDVIGLALIQLSFSAWARGLKYVGWFMVLSMVAMLGKESGMALVAMTPLFIVVYHRRWRQAIVLALAGVALCGAYFVLRNRMVVARPYFGFDSAGTCAAVSLLGLAEAVLYSCVHICFTKNWLCLALNLSSMAIGIAGLTAMLREERKKAIALVIMFLGFSLGVAFQAEPRHMVYQGLIAAVFTCYGLNYMLGLGWSGKRKAMLVALFGANLCAAIGTSDLCRYALQDWIQPLSKQLEALEPGKKPRGNLHEIDVNNRFREELHNWLERRLRGQEGQEGG